MYTLDDDKCLDEEAYETRGTNRPMLSSHQPFPEHSLVRPPINSIPGIGWS